MGIKLICRTFIQLSLILTAMAGAACAHGTVESAPLESPVPQVPAVTVTEQPMEPVVDPLAQYAIPDVACPTDAAVAEQLDRASQLIDLLKQRAVLTEERGWYAMFNLWREHLTKQCLFGGCRINMPSESEFISWLKHERKTREAREASQGETAATPE